MERERRDSSIANGHYSYNTNGDCSRFCHDYRPSNGDKIPSSGYIEHSVSRFHTLAGVAIKYGVEVADIKKMNGLVTDIQMFALRTLQIPLPGRHPPSPCFSNDSPTSGQSSGYQTPTKYFQPDWFESFQTLRLKSPRKVSPAMSSLQGYYGLKATEKRLVSEVSEMAVCRKGEADYVDDGLFLKHSNTLLRLKRKSRSVANGFYNKNDEILADIMSAGEGKDGEPDKSNEKLIRRRKKSEADFTASFLEENNNSGGGGFSLSKRLAPGTKGRNRMSPGTLADFEAGRFVLASTIVGDKLDGFEVRKSSSTSRLHDNEENGSSIGGSSSLTSLWPVSARKSKTALD